MSTKILHRPQECINAHCGAMCSPIDAEFCDCNPKKCFKYERRDDLYMVKAIPLDKVKQAREEMYKKHQEVLSKYGWSNLNISLEILDKLIAESGG